MLGPIDVHCHLLDTCFEEDRDNVIKRARESGILAVIEGTQNLWECKKALELESLNRGFVFFTAGVHPAYADKAELARVIQFIGTNEANIAGIGEVGLDFRIRRDDEGRSPMLDVFKAFIDISAQLSLPLIVHSRSAGRAAIDVLLAMKAKKVVMHAFDGRGSFARQGVDAVFCFSIPPSVVRSQQKRKLVRGLPLDSLLLETDSPVLGPTGKERNEPRNVWIGAEEIAKIKGISLAKVIEATTRNANRIFSRMESR